MDNKQDSVEPTPLIIVEPAAAAQASALEVQQDAIETPTTRSRFRTLAILIALYVCQIRLSLIFRLSRDSCHSSSVQWTSLL